ncbi:tyrosine-type recombinase/integrase [Solimicrobium silvestre]|uniref:Phage integrase family n=1 Tax=Solimicrobium silvestre TaxID=2099400 RepID=A0A2S9GW43_9BURK|nr:tyrosine-type recombinase/integrase [Solimicrobium silvestre]PRC91934.1 Phage integrase family [Solimicrobium silvestre]
MQRERKDGNPLNLPARCHYKHNAFWYIHALTGKWENLGTDIHHARHLAVHYNNDTPANHTMAWIIDDYLLHFEQLVKLKQKAARTLSDYQHYALPLKAHFGALNPEMIDAEQVKNYLDINQQLGRGVRANREKTLLGSVFAWLISTGGGNITVNPCTKIGGNKETPRVRYVSDLDYLAIYQLATPQVQLAMQLAYKTLQNPAEVLRIQRDAIQTDQGVHFIHLIHSKTNKALKIEIDKQLQQAIDNVLPATSTQHYLLASRLGTPYTPTGIAAMLHRYQKNGGIASFGLQDLKVKGALDLAQSGIAIETICDLLGHKSLAVTENFLKHHLNEN